MNDQPAGQTATDAPEPTPTRAPAQTNGMEPDSLENVPLLPPHMRQPEPKPQVRVDADLEEGDLKVHLNVEIHSKNIRIMDSSFETTVCGGVEGKNRGTFYQSLEGLLEHVQRSVAAKVNSMLPVEAPAANEVEADNNRDFLGDGHRLRLAQP